MTRVGRISISPVKAFRLSHPEQVELGADGVVENRRFFLVGPDGERLRSSITPWPVLVRADRIGDGLNAPVTLVSEGSLARLAREAGQARIDARRFRMLFELTGCDAHEEDTWEGRRFSVGEAVIEVGGPVDRCAVTTRDPDTGTRDLDILRLLKDYRGRRESDGAVLFGVYATVQQPGVVRVGDPVEPLS